MRNNLLARNLIANTLNQVLGVGIPVLVQTYIIRTLDLVDISYWNIILSAKSIILLYISFFSIYLVKIIAETSSFKKTQFIITNSIIAIGITAILPIIVYNFYLITIYPEFLELILVSTLPMITYPFSIEYLYQGKLRNEFIFYRKISVKILFILLLISFVKNKSDFYFFVYLSSIIISVEHLVNLYYGKLYLNINYLKIKYIKQIIKGSFPYLPFLVTFNILPHLSIVVGDYLYSSEEIGIYSILFKLINLATTFVSSSAMVLLPMKLMNHSEKIVFSDKKYLMATISVSVFIIIVLILSKDIIFFLFLDEFVVQNMSINYYMLTLYILIHSVYNYIIFNKYFAQNIVMVSTAFNIVIVITYILIVYFSKLYSIEILFATSVIVSSTLGLCTLLIYHWFKNYVWNSRIL